MVAFGSGTLVIKKDNMTPDGTTINDSTGSMLLTKLCVCVCVFKYQGSRLSDIPCKVLFRIVNCFNDRLYLQSVQIRNQ